MSDGASSSNLCLFSCEYWEAAWLSGQVVSDRQIYMDNDLPKGCTLTRVYARSCGLETC